MISTQKLYNMTWLAIIYYSPFLGKEIEVQKVEATCPVSEE
jgi:hypothetical protein